MKWSLQVGRVFGIPIRVHITFLLLLLGVTFLGKYRGIPYEYQYYAIGVVFCIFGCVVAHELSHSLMARRFGVKVDGITLLPIGGVAQMRAMPREPWQEIVIALTGPVTSLALAAILLGLHTLASGEAVTLHRLDLFRGSILLTLFIVNLMLALFNLIPAFPLDGGRVLRGLLSLLVGRDRGTRAAVAIGQFLAIMLFFYGVFARWWLALVAMFIYMGAEGEREEAKLLADLSRGRARDAMLTDPTTLAPDTALDEALEVFRHSSQDDFPVVERGEVVGMLSRRALGRAALGRARNVLVADLMRTNVVRADEDANLEDVYQQMQQQQHAAAAVLRGQSLAGIINTDQINKYELLSRHADSG